RFVYIEQQMLYQLYAVMADAAIRNYESKLANQADAIMYLLDSLQKTLPLDDKTCVIIIDESAEYGCIKDFVCSHKLECAIVFVSHDEIEWQDAGQELGFESIRPGWSTLKVL
ncbi:MAG: hypothetical protein U1C33_05175, partial [Candidatus Cloacimonadaceae bacterium]|nr:hypothetical protein [Candidatus Cloacimonadaceae bacterium]